MSDVSDIIRVGQVSSVNASNNSCRVAFDDLKDPSGREYVSAEMQIVQHNTVSAKHQSLPDVGEHVLCTFLPNGQEEGFILGSYYTASNLPEGHDAGSYRIDFADGTTIEYDLGSNTARIRSDFFVVVEAKEATVTATERIHAEAPEVEVKADIVRITGNVEVTGDISVTGSIHATGTIIDDGGNTDHHDGH